MKITSPSNQKIKYLQALKKRRFREEQGKVFLEGERLIADSLAYGAVIESVFYHEDYKGARIACEDSYDVCAAAFDKAAETVTPQGVLAIAKMPEAGLTAAPGLYVLCDNLRDPGNLGTIFRTAHAAAAKGILLTAGCTDPFGSKCARSSMGSIFGVPSAQVTTQELRDLAQSGCNIYAAVAGKDSESIFDTKLAERSIIAIGNEGEGLGDEVLSLASRHITIPMPGGTESLNAAASAAILIYEYVRQFGG